MFVIKWKVIIQNCLMSHLRRNQFEIRESRGSEEHRRITRKISQRSHLYSGGHHF